MTESAPVFRSPPLALRVVRVARLNPLIAEFRLADPSGAVLPGFAPGAHIPLAVTLEGGEVWRHYSLIDFGGEISTPAEYRIAVRREEPGRGGSRWLHAMLTEGGPVRILPPRNDFPLDLTQDDYVLIAGGIGITPLTGMAAALQRAGKRYALHYAGRSKALLAFLPELSAMAKERLVVHCDDDLATALDVGRLLDAHRPGQPLYVCGPRGLLDRVLAEAKARAWPQEAIRFELFTEATPEAGDQPFEVVLARSGRTLLVSADRTILETMEAAGLSPACDCRRGECSMCQTPVLEGEIDHRDYVLSDEERESGKLIQICISRARGARLVLDI